jgi:hypothetical protein
MTACLAEELFIRTDRTYVRFVHKPKGIKIRLLSMVRTQYTQSVRVVMCVFMAVSPNTYS